jgi:hypothetical protein
VAKSKLAKEFLEYLWQNKMWWMIPIALIMLLLGILVATSGGIMPLIYTFI